jgi:hypothetical protein
MLSPMAGAIVVSAAAHAPLTAASTLVDRDRRRRAA